jgi:hypothetical protein
MTAEQVAAKIEDMFDMQLNGRELMGKLRSLQVELIGEEALEAMRAERFRKYQEEHPWLYPELYPDAVRPANGNRFISPRELSREMLSWLAL